MLPDFSAFEIDLQIRVAILPTAILAILRTYNITRQSETRFTYDEDGRVVCTKTNGIWNNDRFDYREGETRYAPGGNENDAQTFRYDDHENVIEEIDALGGVVSHDYNRYGFRTSTTDQNGNAQRTSYDIHGNVKEVIDAEGRSTIYGWGDNGELMIVIDGAGNRKTFKHDDKSNVIAETDAEGNVTHLRRDDLGHVVETRFPNGAIERRTWDTNNRLKASRMPKAIRLSSSTMSSIALLQRRARMDRVLFATMLPAQAVLIQSVE